MEGAARGADIAGRGAGVACGRFSAASRREAMSAKFWSALAEAAGAGAGLAARAAAGDGGRPRRNRRQRGRCGFGRAYIQFGGKAGQCVGWPASAWAVRVERVAPPAGIARAATTRLRRPRARAGRPAARVGRSGTSEGSGQGCSSTEGAGRGNASAKEARDDAVSRAFWPLTILASTTMSVGPPIISRCSVLSRRIRTSLRLPSTAPASMTANLGARPRAPEPLNAPDPNLRINHAVTPISAKTTANAMKNFTAVGVPSPKRLSIGSTSSQVPRRKTASAPAR